MGVTRDSSGLSGDNGRFNSSSKKAIVSQFFGFFADAYDLTLVLSSSLILTGVFLPPDVPELVKAFELIFSYSLTILARPLGSAIFGNLGDRIGRRRILLITVYSDVFFAAGIAVLPSYAQYGYLGFVLYSIIRFGLGIFLGGEYSAGHPYVMEWTPVRFRGAISGLVQGGFSLGAALSAGIVALFLETFGFDAMVAYAWRYLILTIFIPLVPVFIIRLSIRESPVFETIVKEERKEGLPILSLFRKPVVHDLLQVMTVMTGLFFLSYVLFAYLPIILGSEPSALGSLEVSLVLVLSYSAAFFGAFFTGTISQKFGRRKTGIGISILAMIAAIPVYYMLYLYPATGDLYLTILAGIIAGIVTQAAWGLVPVYLAERFSATHRASGAGFGYSSGIFIGGWFSVYIPLMHTYLFTQIDTTTNVWFSTAFLMVIGGLLAALGFYKGPETAESSLEK